MQLALLNVAPREVSGAPTFVFPVVGLLTDAVGQSNALDVPGSRSYKCFHDSADRCRPSGNRFQLASPNFPFCGTFRRTTSLHEPSTIQTVPQPASGPA